MGSANLKKTCIAIVLAAVLGPLTAVADDAVSTTKYMYEVRVYQALTNVTGTGLNSQTLPGVNGWLQIIHQKLDDVELVMEDDTLTWNGQPVPDYPRIIHVSSPFIYVCEGEQIDVSVGSGTRPVQYMERAQKGLFELKQMEPNDKVGLALKVRPIKLVNGEILTSKIMFEYAWVKGREKIDGVTLDVGYPILDRVAAKGTVEMRLGEWSCYQTSIESEGRIYVFMRATQEGPEPAIPANSLKSEISTGVRDSGKTGKTQSGPKVTVGGTVEIRGGYISGH